MVAVNINPAVTLTDVNVSAASNVPITISLDTQSGSSYYRQTESGLMSNGRHVGCPKHLVACADGFTIEGTRMTNSKRLHDTDCAAFPVSFT